MRLSRQSSRGVQPSFTVLPAVSATSLSTGGTSPGVPCPFNALGGESPRPDPVARWAPRFCRGLRRQVPPCRLRCRSQVFSTSQRLLPLPAVPPFSGGWRSWGSSFRGLILSSKPRTAHRRRHTLVTFFLRVVRPPFLGGGIRRHGRCCLGCRERPPLSSSGSSSSSRVGLRHQRFSPCCDRPAPPGLPPPHGVHLCRREGFPLLTVSLRGNQAVACLPPAAFHGLPSTEAGVLSRDHRPIPRFLAFVRLPRLECDQCWLLRLAPLHLGPPYPLARAVRTSLHRFTPLPEPGEPTVL
jgi:hypothetical protein